ncbi:MAG TPA: late competence development ComFB family protein [Clostridiaceae bacterium]|nr:late competence development ComFB family protein [Clostridiaceae bacterium]
MEEIVFKMMKKVLNDLDVCKCDKCMLDIAAIALNKLPPKYVVTEKGELFSKVNILIQQFEVDIVSAITKAAIQVKNNPRH